MANIYEFFVPSTDGIHQLHCIRWTPDNGQACAVLQLAHGIAETIARYDALAAFLADHGFVVFGNDHLGHGRSFTDEQDKGFFTEQDGWMTVVRDLKAVNQAVREDYPDLPCFMLGHSMGSFLARTYLFTYPDDLAGALLSGTGTQPAATLSLGKLMAGTAKLRVGARGRSNFVYNLCFGAYLKRIPNAETPVDWLSRDSVVCQRYMEDPLCGFVPSVTLLKDMFDGLSLIIRPENAAKMNKAVPVYFYAGEEDPVGNYGKGVTQAVELFRAAGMTDVELKLYPGGRHEMHNELNKAEVYADVLTWLNKKL